MAVPPAPIADPQRIDLRAVQQTLRGGKASDAWMATWLPATYAAPDRFRVGLFAHAGARRGTPMKSEPKGASDLYHDLVIAHLGKRRNAIVERKDGSWERTSYDALHARCSALTVAWAAAGVEAGTKVCAVLRPGLELAVALLTAFRLGAVVSVLPPLGAAFVGHRLSLLEPDRVTTLERNRRLLGAHAATMLPTTAPPRPAPSAPHAYAAGEIALAVVTPFAHEMDDLVIEIEAGRVLDAAVRDGQLVHCLEPGEVLAAPGLDPLQFHPALMLAALAAGATWADLSEETLDEAPKALEELGVTVLGVSRGFRERLLQKDAEPMRPTVRAWFRSLTETQEATRWDVFGKATAERRIPGFGVVADPAAPGIRLWGVPAASTPSLGVWPAAGVPWQLSEIAGGTVLALNDAGVHTIVRDEEPIDAPPRVVLGRFGNGWIYAGTVPLGPDAQAYPEAEVEALAQRHPEVRHASAFVAAGRLLNEAKTVLLLFVEPPLSARADEPAAVDVAALKATIAREMGDRYVPGRIEVFPLRPLVVDGVVDKSWCRGQYLSGMLSKKARSETFRLLSRLGYVFAPPSSEG